MSYRAAFQLFDVQRLMPKGAQHIQQADRQVLIDQKLQAATVTEAWSSS